MKAYLYDNQDVSCTYSLWLGPILQTQGDQRLPHYSGHDVSLDYLDRIGVLYYQISSEEKVDELARQRLYKNRDIITVSPENMGAAYNEKVQSFFHEHLHEDEEIRYIKDGAGYFDVRGENDEWVRIRMEKDDLIVSIYIIMICYFHYHLSFHSVCYW